jgi:hypothetical protein
MEHWRQGQGFRVAAGSHLRLATISENGSSACIIEMAHPSVYRLVVSVTQGIALTNYGFLPPQFKVRPDEARHIRSFQMAVKGRLVFTQRSDPDNRDRDRYVKWAEALFSACGHRWRPWTPQWANHYVKLQRATCASLWRCGSIISTHPEGTSAHLSLKGSRKASSRS